MCLLPFFAFGTSNGTAIESSFSKDGYENQDFDWWNKIFLFSRDTILTFDRRVNIINETECLHKLGLSKELRGGAKTQHEIERARALLPEAFRDFATGKIEL